MKIDLLLPVYDESEVILEFCHELDQVLRHLVTQGETKTNLENDIEVIFVDDGSKDDSIGLISNYKFSVPVSLISFSRNYGHQSAVWAGLEKSRDGASVIVMDCDLQDPPSELSRIVHELQRGGEIILMQRESRKDGLVKKMFASIFYFLQNKLANSETVPNVGDFYGLSSQAKNALLLHTESVKYIRGLVSQLGFRVVVLNYDRHQRRAGVSKYSVSKMFSLALASLTGFSIQPLIWVVYSAVVGIVVGLSLSLYVIYLKLFTTTQLSAGWAFASVSTITLSVLTLLSLAVVSLYLGRVLQEIKKRPLYLIAREKRIEKNED
jgi:glycosyltransferase involved in cell wall biosynthesis